MEQEAKHIALTIQSTNAVAFGLSLAEHLVKRGALVSLLLSQSCVNAAYEELGLKIDVSSLEAAHDILCDALELNKVQAKSLELYFDDEPYSISSKTLKSIDTLVLCPAEVFALEHLIVPSDQKSYARVGHYMQLEQKAIHCYLADTRYALASLEVMLRAQKHGIYLHSLVGDYHIKEGHLQNFIEENTAVIAIELLS